MRKYLVLIVTIGLCANCLAQTQSGYVRTAARPNHESERISGVTLRVRGNHNAVLSTTNGDFQLLMPNLQAGQEFVVSSVMKSGYELCDPEFLGRKQAFSESVPLEIVLVNSMQLLADRQAIEQRARENVELYYEQRLGELNSQLEAKKLDAAKYEQQLAELDEKYDRFEPLLAAMADRYARTDYAQIDELTQRINQAIERGDLDEAQRLIQEKGNMEEREQQVRQLEERDHIAQAELDKLQAQINQQRQETARQKDELIGDYYNMYAIHLSRFENDSALIYICRRAELDTTNATYQLEAGRFVETFFVRHNEAMRYFERALRIAKQNSYQDNIASAYNEIAHIKYQLHEYDAAIENYQLSCKIYEKQYGANHKLVAGRLNNIGRVYFAKNDVKNAKKMFERAITIYKTPGQEDTHMLAELENNMAAIYYKQGKTQDAIARFEHALGVLQQEQTDSRFAINCLQNLGTIYYSQSDAKAYDYYTKALEMAQKVYGASHPKTQQLQQIQQFLANKFDIK